jgi:hypothetical protein
MAFAQRPPPAAMAPSAPTAEPACIFRSPFSRIFHAQPDHASRSSAMSARSR